jgi:hypothetical protein
MIYPAQIYPTQIYPTQPILKYCSNKYCSNIAQQRPKLCSENKLDINSLTKIYKLTHFRLCPGYLAGEFDGVVAD